MCDLFNFRSHNLSLVEKKNTQRTVDHIPSGDLVTLDVLH